MDKLPTNPILEFNPNQMEEVRELFNYSDISRLDQDLNLFEEWIRKQHHFLVKEYDKAYLERYLINSKGSIERAKKFFDKICTLRGLMPDYLQGFDTENEFENFLKIFHVCVLPKPTSQHHRMVFYTVHNPDATLFVHVEMTRHMLMVIQYLTCHDYNAGVEFIFDIRKFTFGFITKLNPIVITNTMTIMIEALGLRLRGLHIISDSKIIDYIMVILKQGMSKKLMSRVQIYENYDSMYKAIPKHLLPKDIGGDLSSADVISYNSFKEFRSPAFVKQMKFMESAATDESKRLCSKFNEEYSGTPGSFKVMTVD